MVNPGNMIQQAIKKGQQNADKGIDKMTILQEQIIERLNWNMIANQEICDKLGIKLKDSLKGYKKGGKK